jgi:ADP-heptose:LPS heptosyltransferase
MPEQFGRPLYNYSMQLTQVSGQGYSGPYRRILAVKLADLGDLLTVTPALQALRAAHPQAKIDLLAPPSSARILDGAPYIDNIIEFDGLSFSSRFAIFHPVKLARIARELISLRLARYDAFVVFHHATLRWGAWERAVLALAVNARVTAGLDNGLPHARAFTSRLTHRVPDRGFGVMHEAGYWLAVAAELGADPDAGWRMHIPVKDEHRQRAAQILEERGVGEGNRVVAIHPGAGTFSRARIWPTGRFAQVARRLMLEHSADIVITGGPDEAEAAQEVVELVGAKTGGRQTVISNFAGRTSVQETAALLERCDLFVGGDSGPMHISVAVGTPVVAVFGPSNRGAWGPYTPPGEPSPHTIIARDLPCQPCFYRALSIGLRDGCGTRPCLLGLGVEPVVAACAARLR